ncbi:uncharacterized protein LY89DRAFT_761218 [Mollisia scopiformis]|uniref:Uncharacterized protein n=1 Tax=Mollisia scopiformis TaxID=149040 RepID=A0A132BB54_MOLSC|nr:uncharacterized protein LY89DRAFT_761218 [Mollisia scopiformis]KUJ09608.1 hypothetical protein LY89DRAFT_761218 [Mollisia scopiformis]
MSRQSKGNKFGGDSILELHKGLTQKYGLFKDRIEANWRSFSEAKRINIVTSRAPIAKGKGSALFPEANVKQLAKSGPEHFLGLLKHRATTKLCDQYLGAKGDMRFVGDGILEDRLFCDESLHHSPVFILFSDDVYGREINTQQTLPPRVQERVDFEKQTGACIEKKVGVLVLERQYGILQILNLMVDAILDTNSTQEVATERAKRSEDVASTALSKLSIYNKPIKATLKDMLERAVEQKGNMEDHLDLCRSEPTIFQYMAQIWFTSRPELVKDNKGAIAKLGDKYISPSIMNMMNNALLGTATWSYMCVLLQLLIDAGDDKIKRPIVLQELSNVTNMEYLRVQKIFKRHVQMGCGAKDFRRVPGVYDNGFARTNMKTDPKDLTASDPQLHYILRLCQPETSANKAILWVKNMDGLYSAHPEDMGRMLEREWEAYGELVVMIGFLDALSTCVTVPAANSTKGANFVNKVRELTQELDEVKNSPDFDLTENAVPLSMLAEDDRSEQVLAKLDEKVVEKAGTKLGFLWDDLVEDSSATFKSYCQQQKQKANQGTNSKEQAPPPSTQKLDLKDLVEARQEKEKTRPGHSSFYIIPQPVVAPEVVEVFPAIKIKVATFAVFQTIFSTGQAQGTGTVAWVAFEAAMIDLGFSVEATGGSIYLFVPAPETADLGIPQRPCTLHRPHSSKLEGNQLLYYRRRLMRAYGWNVGTFELL